MSWFDFLAGFGALALVNVGHSLWTQWRFKRQHEQTLAHWYGLFFRKLQHDVRYCDACRAFRDHVQPDIEKELKVDGHT